MPCVKGEVCRGRGILKVILGKKKLPGVTSLHLEIANYFLITVLTETKLVDIINFVNKRVVILGL
jgi:hypothetical protein